MVSFGGSCREDGAGLPVGGRAAIRHNLAQFRGAVKASGVDWRQLLAQGQADEAALPRAARAALWQVAAAHGLPYLEVLAFNLYEDAFLPDACTVAAAIGTASATGATLLMKNSDLRGFVEDEAPDGYLGHKQIRVVHVVRQADALSYVGVAAAGSLAMKGAINEAGVGYATTLARTREYYRRNPGGETWQVYRGLPKRPGFIGRPAGAAMARARSAREAATLAVTNWMHAAGIYSPGNIVFCDADEAVIVESHYSELAVEVRRSGEVGARANSFQVMRHLNAEDDLSSRCRYQRALTVLAAGARPLSVQDMMRISMDHENGPGPNSICRHSDDFGEETTLSATVMACNREQPEQSQLYVALGKPCRAWPARVLCVPANARLEDIPEEWRNGTIWAACYSETPNVPAGHGNRLA